ncbi:putative transposase [Senna tora]|uniref:Putative transposase n=1 Tax=Senna tora TaxID=362788 RepID=A0A834X7F8_9FABA|nr:putative transposase [Senna tora]
MGDQSDGGQEFHWGEPSDYSSSNPTLPVDDGEVDLVRTDVPATIIDQPLPTLDDQPYEIDYEEDSDFDDSDWDYMEQFKKVKREKVHNKQERLLDSKLKESKGGCHQRQCQKKPPLPKTSTQVESQRVQGDQSQYNKVDTTKKPNQNVAEVQQSNESQHVPKKMKKSQCVHHYQWMTFLVMLKVIMKKLNKMKLKKNEEDNTHHNEVEEENNGDIRKGTSKKRTRGQTSCKNIHARSVEEQEEVILNDDGQPIGPREKTVKDLSLFLGTMARNSTFCPLTYTNWKAMPSDLKDHMWKYINTKFNVPDEGKKWVESTIQDAWRRYKCKIKNLPIEKFANMTERLKHRPATIPESHYKKLCLYWSNENVKSQLKDHLTQNPEQNYIEAFKEVFGKEEAGRVRCYGRNVTPTALKQKEKQNQIMDSMKQEHAKEVNSLKSELQDVKQQILGMQSFIKVWMQQNNSGMNMEDLDFFFRSFPSEANNAQNDEGQCNEHSTTHASNPGQLGEQD